MQSVCGFVGFTLLYDSDSVVVGFQVFKLAEFGLGVPSVVSFSNLGGYLEAKRWQVFRKTSAR